MPAGVAEHFVKARKRHVCPADAVVFQPKVAQVRRDGDRVEFLTHKPSRGSYYKIFMPEGVQGADELYVLWVDPRCACMVTAAQYLDIKGKLPEPTSDDDELTGRGGSVE